MWITQWMRLVFRCKMTHKYPNNKCQFITASYGYWASDIGFSQYSVYDIFKLMKYISWFILFDTIESVGAFWRVCFRTCKVRYPAKVYLVLNFTQQLICSYLSGTGIYFTNDSTHCTPTATIIPFCSYIHPTKLCFHGMTKHLHLCRNWT